MKRKILATVLTVALTAALTLAALAATGAVQITATLDSGVTIQLNGQPQTMTDAGGNPVYPIMYNNTTYLPVRAVSEMLSLSVDWNADTRTVVLGKGEVNDTTLLRDLKPSSTKLYELPDLVEDKFGNVYRNAIWLNPYQGESYVEYYIGKSYTSLKLTLAAAENFGDKRVTAGNEIPADVVSVLGDERALFVSDSIDYKSKPIDIEVDVTDQEYIRISVKSNDWGDHPIIVANAKLS
jgi:hypothetical protein